ncbi:MAG: YdcF family protein [Deltaproteobacteria bacterium]|nr:YdcF family protein [Deltaproteobacteria bacterium]
MVAAQRQAVRADAIIVLGCALHRGAPSRALERRLALAARAYKEDVAPLVVVCGGRAWEGRLEADAMRERLAVLVPEAELLSERRSLTTVENALYAAQVLRGRSVARVLLATCSWHLPRAEQNFRLVGFELVRAPEPWLTGPRPSWGQVLRERVAALRDARLLATRREVR